MTTTEIIIKLLVPVLPTIVLIVGGQYLLNQYFLRRKRKELEIELIKSIRENQYKRLEELYELFAKFMELYRLINNPNINIEDPKVKEELFKSTSQAESKIDALILNIGCEFGRKGDDHDELEMMLGNLRQSVQLWRESIVNSKRLPFSNSSNEDYLRFKSAFAHVSAFMVNRIHDNLEAPKAMMERVESVLIGSFDNKHEDWKSGHFYIGSNN